MSFRRLLGSALLLLPFASATAEPIRITGRVLAERDKPLPGARLSLFSAYEGYDDALRRLTRKGGPDPLASARANAGGAFEILAPESGCFQVVVQAEGYLSEEIALLPLVEDAELPPTTLLKASSVNVLTVGPDGRPLAGIEIRTVESEPWSSRRFQDLFATEWHPRDPRGISDGAGRATLPWFRLYGPATVIAVTPRFLGQTGKAMTLDETITLRLSPTGSRWIEARGADGKPVPGVLARWDGWPVGMTGSDGRLEIAAPAGESALILESREGWHARVVTEGKGILPARLEPRRRIAGRVVDLQNRPVSGAIVWSGRPLTAPAVRSDAAGAFLIEIPAGEESWLQAGAAGFLPGDRRLIGRASAKPIVLTLTPAATLSGIVVDRADRPVSGAEIVLHRMQGRRGVRVRAVSRNDGRFQLTGLQPNGTFRVTATRTGFARTEATARTAAAGQPSPPARIVMEDGQTAFGQVVDDAGQPIAGAEVKLRTQFSASLKTQSDEEGKFEFRHLSPGRISVLASHPGYAPGSLDQIELPSKTPSFDLGTLRLPPGEVIEGLVTDSRGMPIEGAEVSAHQQGASRTAFFDPFDFPEPMRTKSDGSFRIDGLEGGKRINLGVRRAGYVDASLPGVLAPTEEPLRIEMKPARSLSGQVVDPEGEPVANASLMWVQETRIGRGGGFSGQPLGTTDADGKFRVSGLPQGSVDLEVAAEGYANGRIQGLQISPDKDPEDLRIALQRAILLDVLVLTAAGEPVPDVWVRADPLEPGNAESRFLYGRHMRGPDHTDLAGRCRLTLPAPGSYRVSASRQNFPVETQVTVGSASASVELRFPPGTEISGRVIGDDGTLISDASVYLEQTGGIPRQRGNSTQADGTFTFSEVPDGDYRLKAQQSGLTSEILDVTVRGKPVQGLELRLDRQLPGATLTGHILGLPPEDLRQLYVRAFGPRMVESGRPDREGAYRFAKLPPGEWHITANLPDGRSTSGKVEIPPDVTAVELDLNFSSGLTLTGRVTVDGAPLSGAQVQAWNGERVASGTGTAYDGTFTLRNLAAGPTTLLVAGPQGLGGTRTLRMTENQEISIELSTGRLSGRISTITGEPVEEASVRAEAWVPTLKISFSAPGARTGADGAFEIPRIVAGTYKLTISKEGFAPAELTVDIPAGGERTVEIPLNPPGAR